MWTGEEWRNDEMDGVSEAKQTKKRKIAEKQKQKWQNVVVVIKSKHKSIYTDIHINWKPIDGGINITLQKSYKTYYCPVDVWGWK